VRIEDRSTRKVQKYISHQSWATFQDLRYSLLARRSKAAFVGYARLLCNDDPLRPFSAVLDVCMRQKIRFLQILSPLKLSNRQDFGCAVDCIGAVPPGVVETNRHLLPKVAPRVCKPYEDCPFGNFFAPRHCARFTLYWKRRSLT
jgi:hypothetical protein